jgi:hypothetical protein
MRTHYDASWRMRAVHGFDTVIAILELDRYGIGVRGELRRATICCDRYSEMSGDRVGQLGDRSTGAALRWTGHRSTAVAPVKTVRSDRRPVERDVPLLGSVSWSCSEAWRNW